MPAEVSPIDVDQALRERFGLEAFRSGQREVIETILSGRDVLCVMPTGGGKSLCYQLPAVLLPGVTLVVSPLIALMKDQVDALTARGIRATLINSTLELSEQNARIAEVERGQYDLVYVAPERFRSGRFVETMNRVRPALLAIDEAHCISEWGHDFRPDYARLGAARRALGMPPCVALTATATDLVRRDIADGLDLHEPEQFVTGFDRPNLTYHAREVRKDAEKLAVLADILDRNPGSAIVYASSRKKCEEVGNYLSQSLRKEAVVYHAGLSREERSAAQDRFMGGEAEVVVATNAFGMGVDKPDIRSVVHFNMPGTLEAYYQEAGRAGRDGNPAECVLLHAPGDRFLQEMFIENEYPPADAVYRVYEYLRTVDADPIELTQGEIKEKSGVPINDSAVGTALRILEGAGALERFRPRENMAIIRLNLEPDDPPISGRLGPNAHVQKIVALGLEGLVNRRYGEPVYFHPDGFAQTLGLDRPALGRALKNLVSEFPVDYVPPFRGNAVRVLDRDRPARAIKIDLGSLQARKNGEYDKLERMIRYAQTTQCRRSYILSYFGDAKPGNCGSCDNCGRGGSASESAPATVRPIDTPAGREVLQKILSGVARARGRFGKTAVAQMLLGSSSEKMAKSGLTRLTTFGILSGSGFTQNEVVLLIDALAAEGLLEFEEVDRFRPVAKLTEEGLNWVRNPEAPPVTLALEPYLAQKLRYGGLERVPSEPPPAPSSRSPESDESSGGWGGDEDNGSWQPASPVMGDPLWDELKAHRLQWAREANLRPYNVFTNKVLDEIVRLRPTTPHALAGIKGIGPATMEKYGEAILAIVRKAATPATNGQAPASPPPPVADSPPPARTAPPAPTSTYVPTEEWTWRLLDRGFTIEEAAAIRGLEVGAIVRHATWMARKGQRLAPSAFLPEEVIARWERALKSGGPQTPPEGDPLAERFWGLYVACVEGGVPSH